MEDEKSVLLKLIGHNSSSQNKILILQILVQTYDLYMLVTGEQ